MSPFSKFPLLIAITALVLVTAETVFSQIIISNETGRFYIRNFGYKEYDAHQQNWAIVQDERGLIYIGNNWGILEYDGVSWRHIVTDKNSTVISMDIDSSGVIYVGAEQGLGYLAPDSVGQLQFFSLEDRIPADQRDFADVWRVHATRYGVYFFTVNRLFLWANNAFQSWPINAHSYSQAVGDTVFFAETGTGLKRVVGGEPEDVPGGKIFANNRISTIFSFDEKGSLLVGTRARGLFLSEGKHFRPYQTEADPFLRENLLYSGTPLRDGSFAFGTIRGGVAIINRKGEWLHKLDIDSGLRDQTIIHCFSEQQGALWLSFLNGVARVEVLSPFSRFGPESGLESGVEAIQRHKGILYAATHRGVYYLDARKSKRYEMNSFQSVKGISAFSWALISTEDMLLAATDDGVYSIDGADAMPVKNAGKRAFSFYQARDTEQNILVGLTDGLGVLRKLPGGVTQVGRVAGIDVEIRSIAGDDSGCVWLGTNVHGAFLVENLNLSSQPDDAVFQASITRYDGEKLPVGEVNVFNIGGRILFGTERGVRYFDDEMDAFQPDSTFSSAFADTLRYIGRIAEDHSGRVWIFSRKEKTRMFGYAVPTDNGYFEWHDSLFRRIKDVGIIFAIYPEDDGTVWIGGTEGIVRYHPSDYEVADFKAVLRQVTVNSEAIVFAGSYPSTSNQNEKVILPFKKNALRFEFVATAFDEATENQFQYKLSGFEESWSGWTKEVKKDYTNIPEGDYVFEVRARNVYGRISEATSFDFTILPPWYRSWWAYLLYGAGLIHLFVLATRVQARRHGQRSAEILEREKQQAKLREANLRAEAAELKIKAAEAEKEIEKEQIRSRIAGDLHDEIGSNLSSISVISQMLLRKSKLDDSGKKRVSNIYNVAQHTAESMRDIVWFINPANDSMPKLLSRMRETANVMLDHLDFIFSSSDEVASLETELNLRRNVFLIFKEALQNIVKHANASKVEIDFDYIDGNLLALHIKDDGSGFNAAGLSKGNGLKNFELRAGAIGGRVMIDSKTKRGTVIRLVVKIP